MAKKKTVKAEEKPIGVITINGLDKMDEAHKMGVSVWLSKTARFIAEHEGKLFGARFRSRLQGR